MGWNDSGFSRRRASNATASGFSAREKEGKVTVGGRVSGVIAVALRDFAKEKGKSLTKVLKELGIGSSTWTRLRGHEPITQSTVLKIMTYMGTDLRAVLTKYHRSEP